MSSKKIITLDNLSTFKSKLDQTYQPIGNYQPAGNYQPLDPDLTAIAGLTGTSGLLRKIAENSWQLDTNTYATQSYVNTAISNLPEPMVFKGTLGDNGTITSLPTASSSNEGHTYKVTKDGTYASKEAKEGDVFVCASDGSTYSWILIPAGDDVEDTWRNIKVNGTQLLGNAISTGAINFKNGSNVTITGSGNDITIASSYTDTNQKVKQGDVTFGNNDVVNFVGGGNITITGNATNKTMTLGVASGYSIPSTSNQSAWSAKYDKPSGGIPDSDIASASTWNAKQNALSTYDAYSAVGSASAIPVITTNTLGQVTNIDTVAVSIPAVDQTYNASSTNAQSGTAVAGALGNYLPLSGGTMNSLSNILLRGSQTAGTSSANITIQRYWGDTVQSPLTMATRITDSYFRVIEDNTHHVSMCFNSANGGAYFEVQYGTGTSKTWRFRLPTVENASGAFVDLARESSIPKVTTSVTSGSTDVITSGAVFTALGLNSGETGLIEATTAEINALFA